MTADTPFIEYFNVAWRRKHWIVIPLVLGLIVGEVLTRKLPKQYSASASITQTPDIQIDRRYIEAIVNPYLNMKGKELNERVKTTEFLEAVARKLKGLRGDEKPSTADIAALQGAFSLDGGGGKMMIRAKGKEPQFLMDVANAAAEHFISTASVGKKERSDEVIDWAQRQFDEVKQKLIEKDRQIVQFRADHHGFLAEDANAAVGALAHLRDELDKVETDIKEAEDQRANPKGYVDTGAITEDAEGAGNPNGPKQTLVKLQGELTQMLLTKTPKHPDVQAKQAQIAQLEERLKLAHIDSDSSAAGPADTSGPEPVSQAVRKKVEQADQTLAAMKSRQRKLDEDIARNQSIIEESHRFDPQLMALNREKDELQDSYKNIFNKKQSASFSAEFFFDKSYPAQFMLDERATLPKMAVFPIRILFDGMGAGVGAGIGAALIVLMALLDQSYRYAEEIQAHFEVPVVAMVSHIVAPQKKRWFWFWRRRQMEAAT